MKKNSIYNILLAAIAFAGGMLSSCSNETEELSATDGGNLVQFTIGETKSRTTRDLTDLSQIKWEGGETVYVYSPEATTADGKHYAEYTVTVDADGTAKLAYNKDGLRWDTMSGSANFYAYTGESCFLDFTSTTLSFLTLSEQDELVESNVNGKTYYISNSKGRLLASSGEVSWNKPVSFTFNSISTTVDLTLERINHGMYLDKLEYSCQMSVNSLGLMEWNMENNQPVMQDFFSDNGTLTFKLTSAEHVIWGGMEGGPVHILFDLEPVYINETNPLEITLYYTDYQYGHSYKKTISLGGQTLNGSTVKFGYGTYNTLNLSLSVSPDAEGVVKIN